MRNEKQSANLRDETVLLQATINAVNRRKQDITILTKNLRDLISCFVDKHVAKILYALAQLRISSPHEIKNILAVPSRDPIEYHLSKAINMGLVRRISKKEYDYEVYAAVWRVLFPTTNKMCRLFVASDDLDTIIPHYSTWLSGLFTAYKLKELARRGATFEKIYRKKLAAFEKREGLHMRPGDVSAGNCTECNKSVTLHQIKTQTAQYFTGKLFCKHCLVTMMANGKATKLMKDSAK